MLPLIRKFFLLSLLLALVLSSCVRPPQPLLHTDPTPLPKPQIIPASSTLTPIPLPSFTAPPSATPQPAVRIHNADQAFFDGDWEKALVEYQAALANTSEDEVRAEGLLGVARSYLLGRNDYSAIESLENVIAEFPDSRQAASAHFFLAQALNNQERYAEAAQEYQLFLDQRTGAIEAYILNLKGDALFSAGDYSGAEQAYQAVLSAASVLDEIQIRLKLARAYAMAGDYPTALALYDDIYQRTNSDYTRALVDLRKGQAYAELDQLENAQAAYQDAVENFPQTYDAYTALVELIDAGVSVDELQRGIIDYNAGQYGPALSALDHYLQNDPESPALARYYYALTAYAQGNYTEAIRQWDIVIQNYMENPLWADAWEQKAYTQWSNLDLYNDAIETLTTFVEKAPSDPHAAEFLFDAAQVAERDGQFSKAIELYERQASVYPDDEHTPRARFLAALARYRLKDYPAAAEAFKRFEAEAVTLEDKASAGFWLGKALSAAGDADGAQAAWQSAAAIQPTSYYSERARDYTHSRDAFDPPESYDLVFDLQTERRKAADWVKTTFNLPADSDLLGPGDLVNDSYLRRGLELWELGLYDAARGEFEVLRTLSQTDPGKSFRLANLFLDVGAYRPAIMAARQVLNLAGMDDVSSLSAPAYFNHVRFGVYYSDIVMPVAQEYGIHPLFLYALIRQESLFEGFVSSSADARGLMQIMPQTGEEIAANLGWPEDYSADDLYRPNVSLTLGADYLNRQRELFDGDIFAALAAYNGGPGNAAEWIKLAQDDPDLLVEVIRYPETQNYIRRIYENFTIYRMIYNRTP